MISPEIQSEVRSAKKIFHFTTPDVPNADKPHCHSCGEIALSSYFCAGHYVLCAGCMDEAE